MFINKANPIAPCELACPVCINIPGYIRTILRGDHSQALTLIYEKISFASICAYICPAPCEKECRMNTLGKPIAIRALSQLALQKGGINTSGKCFKPVGKKVAVVGSGPAGLTGAYLLARNGHAVTVYEAADELGGTINTCISDDSLPREILDEEIEAIISYGVKIKVRTIISAIDQLFDQGFVAVLLATGTLKNVQTDIKGYHIIDIPEQDIDSSGRIKANPYTMQTSRKGLFAAGALVNISNSIIDVIASGRRAAISINRYLGGTGNLDENLAQQSEEVEYFIPDLVRNRIEIPLVPDTEHGKSFAVLENMVRKEEWVNECKRCLRCDIPIYIDETSCTGCGDCETYCPGDVIRMSEETNKATLRYPQHCWTCYNCELACPVDAIKVSPIAKQRPTAWPVGRGIAKEISRGGN